jgi:hypothetical protein
MSDSYVEGLEATNEELEGIIESLSDRSDKLVEYIQGYRNSLLISYMRVYEYHDQRRHDEVLKKAKSDVVTFVLYSLNEDTTLDWERLDPNMVTMLNSKLVAADRCLHVQLLQLSILEYSGRYLEARAFGVGVRFEVGYLDYIGISFSDIEEAFDRKWESLYG